jgi:tetraacyldisaccharide 4'-kinase
MRAPLYLSEYKAAGLRSIQGRSEALGILEGKKVSAFCGIANPESFRNTLQKAGSIIMELKPYRDHYRYSLKDMDEIKEKAVNLGSDLIITTEKDMVKIRELSRLPSNFYSLEIGLSIDNVFYEEIFRSLDKEQVSTAAAGYASP